MDRARRRSVVLLLLAAGLVACAAAAAVWTLGRRPWARSTEQLVFAGTIEARDVRVGSLAGGRVVAVHVDEGDAVVAGAPLVRLENPPLVRQRQEQAARLAAARAALALVEAGPRIEEIARARADWLRLDAERPRQERLLQQGATTTARHDDARYQAEAQRQVYEELRRGSRPEDVAHARAVVDQEAARMAWFDAQVAELVVHAPAAADVQAVGVRPGDLVAPHQPVITLLERDQLWVRAYVPEPELGRVVVGRPATVEVDTFPGRAFPGRVTRISPRAEYTPRNVQTLRERAEQVFAIRVEVAPSPLLKAGMAAIVRMSPARDVPPARP